MIDFEGARLCRVNCNDADEHNAPSICVMENGTIVVAYTGHSATHSVCYRVTECPYDLSSFGKEQVLHYTESVTYAQDNLPVYWHEGMYGAHTGGWHSDVVTYVDYDD